MGAISRHPDGSRVLTDGIRRDLEIRHNLTEPEAERLFYLIETGGNEDEAAATIKADRVVYRVHVEKNYSPESDPREVAAKRRMWEEAERLGDAPRPADKAAPEAGPYGPGVPYTEATETTSTVTRASDLPR